MYHELGAFVRIRQENLTSEDHKDTVRATTILITSIPENFLNVQTLRQVFSVFPGGVKNVFLNRDCSELLERVEERDKIARMLESAETDLIKMANKADRKEKAKRVKKSKKKNHGRNEDVVELQVSAGGRDNGSVRGNDNDYLVDKYVPKKKRPTHRLPLASWMPSLPLIGKKVCHSTCRSLRVGGYGEMGSGRVDSFEPRDCSRSSTSRTLQRHELSIHPIQHPARSPHGLSERRITPTDVHDSTIYRNAPRGRGMG